MGIELNERDETAIPTVKPAIWIPNKLWWLRNASKFTLVTYTYTLGFFILFTGIMSMWSGMSFIVGATLLGVLLQRTCRVRLNEVAAAKEVVKPAFNFPPPLKLSDIIKVEDVDE